MNNVSTVGTLSLDLVQIHRA